MVKQKRLSDDINHCVWLRKELETGPAFDLVVKKLTISAHAKLGYGTRTDKVDETKKAFSIIIANLYRAYQRDPNLYVVIELGKDKYPASDFNPLRLGIRAVQRAIEYLRSSNPPLVETKGGNHIHVTAKGHTTRFRATKSLIDDINIGLSTKANTLGDLPLTRDTSDANSITTLSLYQVHELPVVRVKAGAENEENGVFQNFEPTERTRAMERNLRQFNLYLKDHWIDLFVPDKESIMVLGGESDGRRGQDADMLLRASLYRVFNKGSLDLGGRFYGGWWQNIPRQLRRYATINWYPTVEVDFSGLLPAMLYALDSLTPPTEPYSLDGVPTSFRPLLKQTFLSLINALGTIRTPPKASLPDGWTFAQICQALKDRHAPIARHFHSGIGLHLQRLDSDIAETVMIKLMAQGILALPVHDSFLVRDDYAPQLRRVMLDAYREHMSQEVSVAATTSWLDDLLPADANELNELGVRSPDDFHADVEQSSEYAGYRARRNAFLKYAGESWGHKHSFFH